MAQEEKIKSNQYTLSGALDSNSAWELEFSYMRRIFPYIGIGAGINIYHQYSDEISASGGNVPGTSINQPMDLILTRNSIGHLNVITTATLVGGKVNLLTFFVEFHNFRKY
jgi:hypothetical protein